MVSKLEMLDLAPKNLQSSYPITQPLSPESGTQEISWRENFIYALLSELIIQWIELSPHLSLDSVLSFSKINNKLDFLQSVQIPYMLHFLKGF